MNHAGLLALSRDELIALILAQHAQIEAQAQQISALTARIGELEAKVATPPKAPDNSSLPPSKGQKANLPDPAETPPRRSRPGWPARRPNTWTRPSRPRLPPVRISTTPSARPINPKSMPTTISTCHQFAQSSLGINRHSGVCPCCRRHVAAPTPEGLDPGSPFGPGLCALILHLDITQAISFERLARLMGEVFGLTISEGAIANILARAQTPLLAAAAPMAAAVRASAWWIRTKPRRGFAARHGGSGCC